MENEKVNEMNDYLIINCPHCNLDVFIHKNEINCRIFRHAVYKNGDQVNPHLDQISCEKLVESDQVYGCCKPFLLNVDNKPEICDYI